ncbi:MAG: glycosyltransferase [Bacteroidia bacterium]|nr:glycosyltransferase [Bacteroidia bacterium]MCF8445528.1 glycosyltransferase [Bacteroidia bacterium]
MFSIIIPLYNKANSIERTIVSVLNQTYVDFELIVVDNNSTDNGITIVSKINDKRIQLVSEKKQGVSAARNKGISLAKNNWITFLDGDDLWEPDNLLELKKLIDAFPNAGLVSNSYKIVESNGNLRLAKYLKGDIKNKVYQHPNFYRAFVKADVPVNSNSVCIPKNILMEMSGFDEGISNGEDILLWSKIFQKEKVVIGEYIGSTYNRNANNRADVPVKVLEEPPVINLFEALFYETSDWKSYKLDFETFIAKLLFLSVMGNIKNGTLKNARKFFKDERLKKLDSNIKLSGAWILASCPLFFSRFLLKKMIQLNLVQ